MLIVIFVLKNKIFLDKLELRLTFKQPQWFSEYLLNLL